MPFAICNDQSLPVLSLPLPSSLLKTTGVGQTLDADHHGTIIAYAHQINSICQV